MIRASILGGSGYGGGELLRLLLAHPEVTVSAISSRSLAGKPVTRAHPNLRGATDLRFCDPDEVTGCDLLFLALPHGEASSQWDSLSSRAERFIDMSADFRLDDPEIYSQHYGPHKRPDLLPTFTYGLAEVNREEIRTSTRVSTGGCNATVSILALLPLYEADVVHRDRTVIDVKVGSSEAGAQSNEGSHHPVRSGVVRPYKATGHRHTAEIEAVLGRSGAARVHLSVSAIDMVRGAAALSHVFLSERLTEKDIWKILRSRYADEPFVRLVSERSGPYRLPEPKLLAGTNFCDIGFELDAASERLVVVSAIDNLVRGSAGQAIQAMNIMMGWDERTGLGFPGLHPI
ncbi:MAG: N-acetyl-gamma-glutamyl-phosphate reductase [Gemmatimonadetes bacterium]|nr:N-acetyl-gamma-glutamyl-phosphate reductase [Gemmatimonadota bacterium]MDA1102566.1 N-acetyl-gamma-glutamyl-phosphate reductase [Gemmatimonadota bacterium]